MVAAFGFPKPIEWVIDKVSGFVGDAATEGFEAMIGGLTAWVVDAVVWVVGGVFHFFLDATDPNVEADWFAAGDGPYATTAGIGAVLLVGFVFAGITQGVLSGDVGGMLRTVALNLPVSVLGMVGLIGVTQSLIRITDELSTGVLEHFEEDIASFTTVVTSLTTLGGTQASAFVVFLLGLATVIAGVILVAELTIRAALIYLVVALAPLVFAAQVWPSLRSGGRKLLELVAALILSKLAMAVALAVAASAMVGAGSGGEVTALPPPESMAEDPGGSVTQAVGILLAAVAAFGVAAFSPLVVAKLLPLTEAALVGQGLRSGPARAAQQAASMAYYAKVGGARLSHTAGGPTIPSGANGAHGGPVAAPTASGARQTSTQQGPSPRREGSATVQGGSGASASRLAPSADPPTNVDQPPARSPTASPSASPRTAKAPGGEAHAPPDPPPRSERPPGSRPDPPPATGPES